MKFDKQQYILNLKKKWPFLIMETAIMAIIITLDLTMKDYLFNLLSTKKNFHMTLIEGFLDLSYSENTGAGFGMFKNGTTALIVITSIVTALIILYLLIIHSDSEWLRVPLVLIASGGIGNLVDRIALRYVRDFFEFTFMDFAIFNIADMFVVIGCIWLIIYLIVLMIQEGSKQKKKFDEENKSAEDKAMEIVRNLEETAQKESSEKKLESNENAGNTDSNGNESSKKESLTDNSGNIQI